jgi:hypothetical protein
LQLFGQQTGLNAGHDLDDEHAGEHRAEHGQQRHGILHDSQGFSLQQQIAHDTAADRGKGGKDQGTEQRVSAFIGEHHAGEGESHDTDEGENAEPLRRRF